MQAAVGDKLVVWGHTVGQRERRATIMEVRGSDGGPPYMVRWDDDPNDVPQDHLFFPGSDADIEQTDIEDTDIEDTDGDTTEG